MKAGASAAASNAAAAGALAAWSAKSDASIGFILAKLRWLNSRSKIERLGRLSTAACSSSASESLSFSATATAPARTAPSQATAKSGVSRMRNSTRSPAHAERRQRSGGARDARGELRESKAFLTADERDTAAVPRQRFLSEQQLRAVHPPGSIRRTVVSPRTSLRHARTMPLARSSG